MIRIFAGTQNPKDYTREQIASWMLNDIQECVAYGKQKGVVIGIQNHADFIQTADHAIEIIEKVNSEWFGLILDTGSYRLHDPYEEIAKTTKYAVNWQVKENIFINGVEKPADIQKLIDLIKASGYRGFIPIETLGPGDPKSKVTELFKKVKRRLVKYLDARCKDRKPKKHVFQLISRTRPLCANVGVNICSKLITETR